jgi:hypothetical protein
MKEEIYNKIFSFIVETRLLHNHRLESIVVHVLSSDDIIFWKLLSRTTYATRPTNEPGDVLFTISNVYLYDIDMHNSSIM